MYGLTYVSVELANEGGEVIVLEVIGEDVASELRRSPHDEGGDAVVAPGNNVVGRGVVDQLVRLRQERRRYRFVRVHCADGRGASSLPAPIHHGRIGLGRGRGGGGGVWCLGFRRKEG